MFAASQKKPCRLKRGIFGRSVINCMAQVSKKSKKVDIVMAAAERFWDLPGVLVPKDPPS
jgi:hypothetical protein